MSVRTRTASSASRRRFIQLSSVPGVPITTCSVTGGGRCPRTRSSMSEVARAVMGGLVRAAIFFSTMRFWITSSRVGQMQIACVLLTPTLTLQASQQGVRQAHICQLCERAARLLCKCRAAPADATNTVQQMMVRRVEARGQTVPRDKLMHQSLPTLRPYCIGCTRQVQQGLVRECTRGAPVASQRRAASRCIALRMCAHIPAQRCDSLTA